MSCPTCYEQQIPTCLEILVIQEVLNDSYSSTVGVRFAALDFNVDITGAIANGTLTVDLTELPEGFLASYPQVKLEVLDYDCEVPLTICGTEYSCVRLLPKVMTGADTSLIIGGCCG